MLEFLNSMCAIIQQAYGVVGMNCLLCFVNEFMIDSLINQSGLNLFWQVRDSEVVLEKENLYTDAHHSTPRVIYPLPHGYLNGVIQQYGSSWLCVDMYRRREVYTERW